MPGAPGQFRRGPDARLTHVRAVWDSLAETDPLWAVLSHDGTEHGRWDEAAFDQTGEDDVRHVLEQAAAAGWQPAAGMTALDFGCGVGRLTRPLAGRFAAVTGVDISPAMLDLARARGTADDRIRYCLNTTGALPFDDSTFDFALSLITLQHLGRTEARGYLRELVRVVHPGGMLVVQLPDEHLVVSNSSAAWKRETMRRLPGPVRDGIHRLRAPRDLRRLDMRGFPRKQVMALLQDCGGRVAAVHDDGGAGKNWRSYRYLVDPGSPRSSSARRSG